MIWSIQKGQRANNNFTGIYNQETNAGAYNYSGNINQEQFLDERDKQIQQLQQENQFLKNRIKYLEQNLEIDTILDSQEKIFKLTDTYFNQIIENTFIYLANSLHNKFNDHSALLYQIDSDIHLKNAQVDQNLEDYRKKIDQIKSNNRTSANFCETIMYKLSRIIKKLNFGYLEAKSQQQFSQNMNIHNPNNYFIGNNMMNRQQYPQQIQQFSNLQQQQQHYLFQSHNPLIQSHINHMITHSQVSPILGIQPQQIQHLAQNNQQDHINPSIHTLQQLNQQSSQQ